MNQTTKYSQPETAQAPEIEIHYKTAVRPAQRPEIQNAPDVYNIMTENGEMSRNMEYKEMFFALYLNQANKLLALHKIGEGTTTAAPVDVKFIMQGAIMTNRQTNDREDTESRRTFRHPTDRQRDNNRRQLFFICRRGHNISDKERAGQTPPALNNLIFHT